MIQLIRKEHNDVSQRAGYLIAGWEELKGYPQPIGEWVMLTSDVPGDSAV